MRKSIEILREADWTLNDRCLSEQFGLAAPTVWNERKRLGLPKGVNGRKPMPDHVFKIQPDVSLDFSLTNTALAKQLGVTPERIRQLREKAGLPSSLTLWAGKKMPPSWTDGIDWSHSNRSIAEETGRAFESVRHARERYGFPMPDFLNQRGRKYDWSAVDWSLKNKAISAMTGIPTGFVANIRHRRKIAKLVAKVAE